ncbi:hypothetical protein BDV10DRAFT_179553 [Aspergillus recurvatus]
MPSTQCHPPILKTVCAEQNPAKQSAKQDHDLEGDRSAMNEVDQDARRELRVYEESFDWMRIQKRRFYASEH